MLLAFSSGVGRRVAERGHAEDFGRGLALFAAGGIFTAGQFVFDVRVHDEHGDRRIVHRHQFRLARAAIEQEQMIFAAHDGNELVHDAAGHAGEFMFGLLAEQRLFNRINLFAGDDFEQGGGGHFERGAAGQAATQRDGRVQQHVKTQGSFRRAAESPR